MSKIKNYLLDTNCVLYLLKGNKDIAALTDGNILATNFIIEVELLGWKNLNEKEIGVIHSYIDATYYYDYSTKIKEKAIALRRLYNLKLADAFVAATAIVYDLILVSADKVFGKIDELHFHPFLIK
jgi:predicted nucleic acid-binding protein